MLLIRGEETRHKRLDCTIVIIQEREVEVGHVQMSMIDIWLIGVIGITTTLNKATQERGSILEL